jgi:hypothetical protein
MKPSEREGAVSPRGLGTDRPLALLVERYDGSSDQSPLIARHGPTYGPFLSRPNLGLIVIWTTKFAAVSNRSNLNADSGQSLYSWPIDLHVADLGRVESSGIYPDSVRTGREVPYSVGPIWRSGRESSRFSIVLSRSNLGMRNWLIAAVHNGATDLSTFCLPRLTQIGPNECEKHKKAAERHEPSLPLQAPSGNGQLHAISDTWPRALLPSRSTHLAYLCAGGPACLFTSSFVSSRCRARRRGAGVSRAANFPECAVFVH